MVTKTKDNTTNLVENFGESLAVSGQAIYPVPTTSLKTVEEVRAAVDKNYQTDYQGKTETKNGFTYIPWDRATDLANTLFGVDGYDATLEKTWREDVVGPDGTITYGYSAIVRVVVHVLDNGVVRHIVRDGLGFNEMEFTKSGKAMIDAAIKGAASGALLRALVLLGNAFGLYLYDGPASTPSTGGNINGTYTPSSNGGGRTLSDKQIGVLVNKLNITDAEARAIPFQQGKEAIDSIFGGGNVKDIRETLGITTQATDRYPLPR